MGESVNYDKASGRIDALCPLKRFDQYVWPFSVRVKRNRKHQSFSLISLENGQKLMEFIDFRGKRKTYSVNWNISEIGRTFYDSNRNFIFKISRLTTSENMTLKHLARMAVLTSFGEDFLSNQNLPHTLFEYLGIKRK